MVMKMKFFFLTCLVLMASAFTLQSCLDDDDDDCYVICPVNQPNALVTVKPNADNTAFFMQLDDSTAIWPVNMRQSPFGNKEVRALINFRKPTEKEVSKSGLDGNKEYFVFVNWIDSILTKPMVESMGPAEENLRKYGSDPLEVVDDWVTLVEDGYLTLRLRTRWGGNTKHVVNLVHRQDVNTPYYFTLYQDAKGDTQGQMGDALVAFKLADHVMPQHNIEKETLTLEWLSYTGKKTVRFKFRPGNVIRENTESALSFKGFE